MTDFPDLKIKTLVNFPSTAIGGTGIDVNKVSGNFVVDLAYQDFAPPVAGVSDPTHQNVLLWNSVTRQYALTPISLVGGGNVTGPASAISGNIATYNGVTGTLIQDGGQSIASLVIPPATNPPQMDGTAAIGAVSRYAKEDHIHPTDTSRAALTQVVRYDAVQALTSAQQAQARSNVGVPGTNVVINGDFRINQAGYVSAAVLAAGLYGHDQWKAGASGGDYSFTQLKSSTQITIASGKSLIQPIEDVNIVGGSYVLSWTGTAQARAGVNTLTPSGSYAASPLLIAGQTAGTVMSLEFNSGTLGTVKLESGALATPFIMRPFDQELLTSQRYFQILGGVSSARILGGPAVTATVVRSLASFYPTMRTAPAASVVSVGSFSNEASTAATAISAFGGSPSNITVDWTLSGMTVNSAQMIRVNDATGRLIFDARL